MAWLCWVPLVPRLFRCSRRRPSGDQRPVPAFVLTLVSWVGREPSARRARIACPPSRRGETQPGKPIRPPLEAGPATAVPRH